MRIGFAVCAAEANTGSAERDGEAIAVEQIKGLLRVLLKLASGTDAIDVAAGSIKS